MNRDLAALSSTATALDDIIDRVVTTAEALVQEQEDVAADLFEVERSLRAGARRLATVLRRAERG